MKQGETFFVSTGEYSDYGIGGHYQVVKSFSMDKEVAKWKRLHPEPDYDMYTGTGANLLRTLEERGLVKSVEVREVFLGTGWAQIKNEDKMNDEEDG